MKIYGIISEYNPFHNGHIEHIKRTREHGATHIVAVMSGGFVQRGDVAIIDKFKRAKIAVNNGVDLVVELPVVYALSAAEFFSKAGVFLLHKLGVDGISFGSECGDVGLLKEAAMAAETVSKSEKLKKMTEMGISYPKAMQKITEMTISAEIAAVFRTPNNTLAVEYLKALDYFNMDIDVFTMKRMGVEHDSLEVSGNIASGSKIRDMIKSDYYNNYNSIQNFVPADMFEAIAEYKQNGKLASLDNLERVLLYKLRTSSIDDIANIPDVGQGLQNRIYEMGRKATGLSEYFELVKTKRYTAARIRRILLCLLIGIVKADYDILPPYGRILALNERGTQILKKVGENTENPIPFTTSLKSLADMNELNITRFIELSTKSEDLYGLALGNIVASGSDFTAKIVMQ